MGWRAAAAEGWLSYSRDRTRRERCGAEEVGEREQREMMGEFFFVRATGRIITTSARRRPRFFSVSPHQSISFAGSGRGVGWRKRRRRTAIEKYVNWKGRFWHGRRHPSGLKRRVPFIWCSVHRAIHQSNQSTNREESTIREGFERLGFGTLHGVTPPGTYERVHPVALSTWVYR